VGYQQLCVLVDKRCVATYGRFDIFEALTVATEGFYTFGVTLKDVSVPAKFQSFWEFVLLHLWQIPNKEVKHRKGGAVFLKPDTRGRQAVKSLSSRIAACS
jgi:hypothetical protein